MKASAGAPLLRIRRGAGGKPRGGHYRRMVSTAWENRRAFLWANWCIAARFAGAAKPSTVARCVTDVRRMTCRAGAHAYLTYQATHGQNSPARLLCRRAWLCLIKRMFFYMRSLLTARITPAIGDHCFQAAGGTKRSPWKQAMPGGRAWAGMAPPFSACVARAYWKASGEWLFSSLKGLRIAPQ